MQHFKSLLSGLTGRGVEVAAADDAAEDTIEGAAPEAGDPVEGSGDDTASHADDGDSGEAPAEAPAEPNADNDAAGDAAAQAQARMAAVFASEHYAGREAAGNKLLLNAKLDADEIIGLLAEMPKASGSLDMLNGMGGDNPDIGAGNAADPDPKAEAEKGWAKTFDRLGWN